MRDFKTSEWRRLALAALAALAGPAPVLAWTTPEHQEIGREAYTAACAQLTSEVAAGRARDPAVAARLDRVCGANLPVLARLYGDGSAIAGDFLGHPSEFLSQTGAWRFSSKKHYWLLALENSQHFNPTSTRSWAEYHQRAVEYALAGAAAPGLTSVQQLELALFENAFADHYLQDSFAAGHMGFNRAASSAAAAKSFHDTWNQSGRVVTDRAGERWVSYGDGRLDDAANAGSRQHLMRAATLSVRSLLAAFVRGVADPEGEMAVWQTLPFTIEAPQLLTDVMEVFVREPAFDQTGTLEGFLGLPATTPPGKAQLRQRDRSLIPLQVAIRPATKDLVATGTFWSAASFSDPDNPTLAVVAGLELGIPFVPAQSYLGAGATLRTPGQRPAAVIDSGLLIPLGLSVSGLLSHQVDVTASWLLRRELGVIAHAEYQLNLELGDLLVSAQGGVAEIFPHRHTGYYAGFALGYVFSAAGGGAF